MKQAEPSGNPFTSWSDEGLGATEFLVAEERDVTLPPHMHVTFTIGAIEAGGHRVRPGRQSTLVVPQGTLGLVNPGVVHAHNGTVAGTRGLGYRVAYPSPALVASVLEHPRCGPQSGEWSLPQHVINDPQLYREFLALHAASQLNETLLERQTRLGEFLRRLFERHGNFVPERNRSPKAPHTVARVRDYLHSMFQEQVSIDDLSRAAGVSGTQVVRAFSAATGMPPHAYLVALRVDHARVLLRSGRAPAEVAFDTGFYDQSQFTRHFKRLSGVTPARFAAIASAPRTRDDH